MVKLPKISPKSKYYQIIDYESHIGAQIFGPIPFGHQRQFFCFNPYTWVWHEEWKDDQKNNHVQTTFYHIRSDKVVKSYGDQIYYSLDEKEYRNFIQAAKIYCKIVPPKIATLK